MKAEKVHKKREYLRVLAEMDGAGFMLPRTIFWTDGRQFQIDGIRDFKPANSTIGLSDIDWYVVLIHGQERSLYFERLDPLFFGRYGRWYVEVQQ